MTVRITDDDELVVEWHTPEEAADCLRDLKLHKALLLLRRDSLERLIARVDGATVELAAKVRNALPLYRRG